MSLEELEVTESVEQTLHEASVNADADFAEVMEVTVIDEDTVEIEYTIKDSTTSFTESYSVPTGKYLPESHPINQLCSYWDISPGAITTAQGEEVPVTYDQTANSWVVNLSVQDETSESTHSDISITDSVIYQSIFGHAVIAVPFLLAVGVIGLVLLLMTIRVGVRNPPILMGVFILIVGFIGVYLSWASGKL